MKYTITKDKNNFYYIHTEDKLGKHSIGFFHTYEDAVNAVQRLIKNENIGE